MVEHVVSYWVAACVVVMGVEGRVFYSKYPFGVSLVSAFAMNVRRPTEETLYDRYDGTARNWRAPEMNFSSKREWPGPGPNSGWSLKTLLAVLLLLMIGVAFLGWFGLRGDAESRWADCKITPDPDCLLEGIVFLATRGEDEIRRDGNLQLLGTGFAFGGENKTAFAMSSRIETASFRGLVLGTIVSEQAKNSHFTKATEIARSLDGELDRSSALLEIASALVSDQLFDQAQKLSNEIERPDYREMALVSVAKRLALTSEMDRAETLASTFHNEGRKATTFAAFAAAYSRMGRSDLAIENAKKAVNFLRDARAHYNIYYKSASVAEHLATPALFPLIVQFCSENDDPSSCDFTLETAVKHLVLNGHTELAIAFADDINDLKLRDDVTHGIVGAMAELGQFDDALDYTTKIGDDAQSSSTLAEIAITQSEKELFTAALQSVRDISNEKSRFRAQMAIAENLSDGGEYETAHAVINEALHTARAIMDNIERATRLIEIAKQSALAGRLDEAVRLALEAMEIVEGSNVARVNYILFGETLAILRR